MTSAEQSAVMTIPEVAAFLKLAESTVYRLAKDGKLLAWKVGSVWRFSRKGIEDWLSQFPTEVVLDGDTP